MYSSGSKRIKLSTDSREDQPQEKKPRSSVSINVVDFSVPSTFCDVVESFTSEQYGSVTEDIKQLMAWKMKMLDPYFVEYPELARKFKDEFGTETRHAPEGDVINLDDDDDNVPLMQLFPFLRPLPVLQPAVGSGLAPLIILDSDDEDIAEDRNINCAFQETVLPPVNVHKPGHITTGIKAMKHLESGTRKKEEVNLAAEVELKKDKGLYVGVEDDGETKIEDDGLGDIWKNMPTALELSKDVCDDPTSDDFEQEDAKDCEIVLPPVNVPKPGHITTDIKAMKHLESGTRKKEEVNLAAEVELKKDKGLYVGVEDDGETEIEDDGLGDIWKNMPTALELSKDVCDDPTSDDIDQEDEKDCKIVLPPVNVHKPGHITTDIKAMKHLESVSRKKEEVNLAAEVELKKDKGLYVGVEDDDETEIEDDGLGDIWKDMSMALELSKDVCEDPASDDIEQEDEKDCEHSFMLKDDLGYVCRVCGVIERGIETIIEIQILKRQKSTRTYASDSGNRDSADTSIRLSEQDLIATDVFAHPRHAKQMKPHQVEGFNFLRRNLLADNPGGCILAHAPGSGKTFMIISFMQAFLAKHPQAKPLVVLPKGIIPIWKKEFQRWQVEDLPLLDFYSVKADNRSQQLAVLKKWVEQKSILFLGYMQMPSIIFDEDNSQVATACKELLIKAPSILILDEGHTPRNEKTNVLQSLAKVQTPRKVALSGTLYQNHVKEVFTVLNLVRPKFMRLDTSRSVIKRIMSRVNIPGIRKNVKAEANDVFFESVEHTLQKDEDFRRKVTVIKDLREMTSRILHYYKGDFLDELPGLVDFTVVLNLTPKQKKEIEKLKQQEQKFRVSSVGSAIYLHPLLGSFPKLKSEKSLSEADHQMDELLGKLDVRDGIKAKFFLNMLNLCVSADEKLLVFSQYLLPLKFLERLTIKTKSWSTGREIFTISGKSSTEQREYAMDRFNNSAKARVFFGSIKACGEGISLVGASRIIILDVHLNPSVTRQAIGRAFRPGQKKKVYTYRLIGTDSPEEEDHNMCFKKELISKMWFEWNEYCGYQDFKVDNLNVEECGDLFLESPALKEDVKALYKR